MELAITLGAILFFLHLCGIYGGLYDKSLGFGALTHFIGGMFLYSIFPNLITIFVLVVLWELFEACFQWVFPKHSKMLCWYSRTFNGGVSDIFWGMAGASLLWII